MIQSIVSRITLFSSLILLTGSTFAQIEQRCVLMIDRFQDPADLPQFQPVFDQALTVDGLLSFDIDTSDPVDQNGLNFRLSQAPAGMSIDSATGVVTWQPDALQVGVISATVLVTDADQRRNRHTFCIEVVDPSAAPTISPIADTAVLLDTLFSLAVVASDPDPGDVLTFSLDQAPAGMSIDAASGLLEWTPGLADLGSADVVVRVADDAGQADIEPFALTVIESNEAPVIVPIADRGAQSGVDVAIQVEAGDTDDTDLTFSLPVRPSGMTIDAQTGLIHWVPVTQQLGSHPITVRVTDPKGFSDQTGFSILVDFNRAPVAVDDDGYRVERGDTLVVTAPGVLANDTDPNGDTLSALAVSGPVRGTLSLDADGGFEYTPDNPAGTIALSPKWSLLDQNGSNTWQPLIANLDDDPASEIFVVGGSSFTTLLIAIDGQSGTVDWQRGFAGRQIFGSPKPAIGDIDLDGKPEIIVAGGEPDAFPTSVTRLYAFEHDGHIKWISEPLAERLFPAGSSFGTSEGLMGDAAISLADLDGDGTPEVLVAPTGSGFQARLQVWDHQGRKLDRFSAPGTAIGRPSRVTVVDLDLDGDPEVVVGNAAWSHEGQLLWTRTDNFSNLLSKNFPIVANLDDDPYPELVRTRGGGSFPDNRGNVVAWNHDGTDLLTPAGDPWEVARTSGFNTAPMTIADVDADGYADVLFPNALGSDLFEVLDGRDGEVKWSKTVPTRSGGATVLDLDRDGFVEVVFVDSDSTLHIWDGRDGTEKAAIPLDTPRPANYTLPVFADVDADGTAELVIPGGFSFGFDEVVSVWESPADDWPPMRSIWNEQRYHVTNVNDDLTIPARERPHWLLPGLNQAMINERLPEERTEDSDSFTYRASDGEFDSNVATVDITILPPNSPPRIVSSPRLLASPGFEYVYRALAVDADAGEILAWSLAENPPGMSIDALGTLRWVPAGSDLGEHVVAVEVADSIGVSAFQSFVIDVVPAGTTPDLAGLTEAQAIAAVEDAGLVVDPLRDVFSDLVPSGEVASQQPLGGTAIAAGGSVEVSISLGPVPVTVPDIIGLTEADAMAEVDAAGLTTGAVAFVNDPNMPVGAVLTQDPPPRSKAGPGTSVDLVVSGGPRALIRVEPPVITSGGSAEVFVELRNIDGTPLDPQPAVTLSLDIDPASSSGTPPTLSGSTIQTAADTLGGFEVIASYSAPDLESIAEQAVVLAPISDGPNGDLHSRFSLQLQQFGALIEVLQIAIDAGDGPAIEALDQDLADLADAIDLRRLRTMVPLTPPEGMLPTADQAIAGGLLAGGDDESYVDISLELVAQLEALVDVMREGTAPDVVINQLNQDLAETAATLAALEPSAPGVLEAGGAITAVTGTFAPRLLVADIEAVRQALRDEGIITADGQAAGAARFTVLGLLSATRIRNTIITDFYVPYLWRVGGMMGAVIAADLLQTYVNAGAVSGLITGASQTLHAFHIAPSVIEGFGFDPTLSPNNAVTMIGPALFEAAAGAAGALGDAASVEDVNSAFDAVQGVLDGANNLEAAWDDANSMPMGVNVRLHSRWHAGLPAVGVSRRLCQRLRRQRPAEPARPGADHRAKSQDQRLGRVCRQLRGLRGGLNLDSRPNAKNLTGIASLIFLKSDFAKFWGRKYGIDYRNQGGAPFL